MFRCTEEVDFVGGCMDEEKRIIISDAHTHSVLLAVPVIGPPWESFNKYYEFNEFIACGHLPGSPGPVNLSEDGSGMLLVGSKDSGRLRAFDYKSLIEFGW